MRLFSMPLIYMRIALLASGIFTIGRFWQKSRDSGAVKVSSLSKDSSKQAIEINFAVPQLRHS